MFTKKWFLGQAVLWPIGLMVGVLLGVGIVWTVEYGDWMFTVLVRSLIGG
ncbi:MAG: hypothetical protein SVY53_05145 [Chloroflexota bacterium]|nr:hypothetical protein [Chloroflexota bacterium]